jgi:hypothetical protein
MPAPERKPYQKKEEPRSARCRSCGAPVWFLRHERSGKLAPVEQATSPAGNAVANLPEASYRLARAGDEPAERRWMHHITCPQGKAWRRPKGPPNG